MVTTPPDVSYLGHVDELGEDLGSLLGCVSAEDHQLDPLGDAVAHHDGTFQRRVVPHRAAHHVAVVVQELTNQRTAIGGQAGDQCVNSEGFCFFFRGDLELGFSTRCGRSVLLTETLQKFLNSR